MAVRKSPSTKSKSKSSTSKSRSLKSSKSTSTSKSKSKPSSSKRTPLPTQQTTKRPLSLRAKISAQRAANRAKYTPRQLNLPTFNTVIPAGADHPLTTSSKSHLLNQSASRPKSTGKKRNKIFIDDAESMMAIMAVVNAEKEGKIESRMVRARKLEEVREARAREAEKRREERGKIVGVVKGEIREERRERRRNMRLRLGKWGKRRRGEGEGGDGGGTEGGEAEGEGGREKKRGKRVAFARE